MKATLIVVLMASCGGVTREQVVRSQREFDLAVGLYEEHNVPAAFEHLLESLELDRENPEAHLLLGKLLMIHRSDFEQAEHHMREAIRVNAIHEVRVGLPADARNALGVLFINAGRYQDAVEVLREASSDLMNREPELTYANLARAYLELEQLDEALQSAMQSQQQSPNFCVGLFWLGEVRVAREERVAALEVLDHLLGLEQCQSLQRAWRIRGEVKAHLSDREGAVADFESCVELGPQTEDGQACQRYLATSP
jgi:tetratricopeptide (TPR) repeat protein